jgi:hypothetical protein
MTPVLCRMYTRHYVCRYYYVNVTIELYDTYYIEIVPILLSSSRIRHVL